MLIVDDFVMLGKTVPEPNSDGRVFVCSAGVSATLRSLVRIYPLARRETPPRWSVSTVPLIRNSQDNRIESFKLAGDRSPAEHDRINAVFEVNREEYPRQHRADLLAPYEVASIAEANSKRISLAVLHPKSLELGFEYNPDSPDSPQLKLFDVDEQPRQGAKRFAYIPRLRFKDADGEHHLMIRDWGVYERMRKEHGFETWPESKRVAYMTDALHVDETCSLLVGNFNQHRTAWLVISVLRGVVRAEPTLLDEVTA